MQAVQLVPRQVCRGKSSSRGTLEICSSVIDGAAEATVMTEVIAKRIVVNFIMRDAGLIC